MTDIEKTIIDAAIKLNDSGNLNGLKEKDQAILISQQSIVELGLDNITDREFNAIAELIGRITRMNSSALVQWVAKNGGPALRKNPEEVDLSKRLMK